VEQTEEEQLERLKEWWNKNGKLVIAGVVVGLATVIGTRMWTDSNNSYAEAASQQYESLLGLVEQGDSAQAEQVAGSMLTEYSGTPYASFAKLMLARLKAEQGDLVSAQAFLQQTIDGAGLDGIRQVARLRLARVLLADGKPDAALVALEGDSSAQLPADGEIIKGDIFLAQGKQSEARNAYNRAMIIGGGGNRSLLQMKLDDLALADGEKAAP